MTASTDASASDHGLKSSQLFSIKRTICFSFTFITVLIFVQLQAVNIPLPSSSWATTLPFGPSVPSDNVNGSRYLSMLRDSVTFLPLNDIRYPSNPNLEEISFISSINDTYLPNEYKYLQFPSEASRNRILCVSGNDTKRGASNSYAFAYPESLPESATLRKGLTVVVNTHDYSNIWHGLSVLVPFLAWQQNNKCERPERWVLYHWGVLRTETSRWVKALADASMGKEIKIELLEGGARPICFERAVVFRHNEGGMGLAARQGVYDMMRCKARAYCNVKMDDEQLKLVKMTVLLRESRTFRDEKAVIANFQEQCRKMKECRMKVAWLLNSTFCEQVKLLSETDILISPHGAQMTNMIFMDKGSSVMEFFPHGWVGHGNVFLWLADYSGMKHHGHWNDPDGKPCPYKASYDCFLFYKDGEIGHNKTFFAEWTTKVLQEVRQKKQSSNQQQYKSPTCPCS